MDQIETIQEIREKVAKIEVLLENMTNVSKLQLENLEEKIRVANHRIDDLETTITWLQRSVIGGLLAGAIALLFK